MVKSWFYTHSEDGHQSIFTWIYIAIMFGFPWHGMDDSPHSSHVCSLLFPGNLTMPHMIFDDPLGGYFYQYILKSFKHISGIAILISISIFIPL